MYFSMALQKKLAITWSEIFLLIFLFSIKCVHHKDEINNFLHATKKPWNIFFQIEKDTDDERNNSFAFNTYNSYLSHVKKNIRPKKYLQISEKKMQFLLYNFSFFVGRLTHWDRIAIKLLACHFKNQHWNGWNHRTHFRFLFVFSNHSF